MSCIDRVRKERAKSWCYGALQSIKPMSPRQRMLRRHRILRATRPCQRCKRDLPLKVWRSEVWGTENGLEVSFDGGYAEFIDAWQGAVKIWLCHECGHDLADWLGLDVHNWHTHSVNGNQHPDHHDGADA